MIFLLGKETTLNENILSPDILLIDIDSLVDYLLIFHVVSKC